MSDVRQALAEWDDPRVQIVYRILCDDNAPPNLDDHWEGYAARRIVAALALPAAQPLREPVRWQHADGGLYEVLTLNAKYKYGVEAWNDGYVVYRGEDNQIYVTNSERFNKRFTRVPDASPAPSDSP